ncbi:MAG: NAD(P)/FAD-dependent oxidoreductase [Magnetococcales bacterium]|nr:NAD(P)/FAD-dependent oxidoreductase [Magnetococcales bacterium]
MMQVSIIGSGFAALAAVRKLRDLDLGRRLEITVISPKASLTYLPSLIWVPSGIRTGEDLRVSLERYFKEMGVHHHAGEVTSIEYKGRIVQTTHGEVYNDALIIASGASYLRKAPGIENTINPCSGISAAQAIRKRLSCMSGGTVAMGFSGNPKEAAGVRGGPMFEFLFGLHTQLKRERRRDNFKLAFVSPMRQPGKRLGTKAVKGLLKAMKKRDVETHLGHKIVSFGPDSVTTEAGSFHSDLTVFLPGMTGQPWFASTDFELSEGGFFKADGSCRVQGNAEQVWVAGDAGSMPGPLWQAKQAHMAEIQARTAATNVYRTFKGQDADATFKNELICIVDTLDSGMLVSRFPNFSLMLPPTRMMHYLKRFLEYKHLYYYR